MWPDRQPGCHVSDQPGKQRIGDHRKPVSQQNVRIGLANPGERATPTKTKGKREGARDAETKTQERAAVDG